MGVIGWILIGVIGGWIASSIAQRAVGAGYIVNIIVGIVGAVAGGFSANLVTRQPVFGFSTASIFVSILGALVFLAVAAAVRRR